MSRLIKVDLDKAEVYAEVSGYGSRALLVDVGAKPVWLGRRKVWSVSYGHGVDVIALAEYLGYAVTCNHPLLPPAEELFTAVNSDPEPEPEDVALW